MKVIVKNKFRDKKEDKIRNVGDVFTCSKQRFAEINKNETGHVFVEEYVEPEEQEAEENKETEEVKQEAETQE